LANLGAGIAMPADTSKRVACSIIKVGLLAALYFHGLQFDEISARGRCDEPKRSIVKLLDGLIFASA
jgi:hypothetical protein